MIGRRKEIESVEPASYGVEGVSETVREARQSIFSDSNSIQAAAGIVALEGLTGRKLLTDEARKLVAQWALYNAPEIVNTLINRQVAHAMRPDQVIETASGAHYLADSLYITLASLPTLDSARIE